MDKLRPDSTILSVWNSLTHQSQYVRGVMSKMRECRDMNGNASVRIGITGSGQKPYYRVFGITADGIELISGSYYDNHDPLESGFAETKNWSSSSMTLAELEDFFAAKIGYTGRRPS